MKVRIGLAVAALALGGLAAGCGSDEEKPAEQSEQAEGQQTPARAIAEIAIVRTALGEALDTYRSGDKAAADEQVGDAYLQHFELVEGPLEEVDEELTEELEDGIRETLRDRIKEGAPVADVEKLIDEINTELGEAETALQQ